MYCIILIAILSIDSIRALPVAWPSEPESVPKNPFAPSNPFTQKRPQQDLPLPQNSLNQQPANPNLISPTGIGFNDGDNAAFWPTPPPIGGIPSSSFQETPHSPGRQIQLPVSENVALRPAFNQNPNPVVQQNSQQFNSDLLITPPPIPGFEPPGGQPVYPKTPGDAHLLAQTKNKGQLSGNSSPGNPFDKLPVQNQQQTFDVNNSNMVKKNPFDSLPIRSRQRRQGIVHNFGPNPNKAWPGANQNPAMSNPAGNNFPKTPGEARFMNSMPGNPAKIANPSSIPGANANPSVPGNLPTMSNSPTDPLTNPNNIPTSLKSNPALSSAFMPPLPNNQLQAPIVPPSSISGFPNTKGQVVLGPSPSLPDISEQKALLPSQMADPNSLVLSQNGPMREHKILLPSQIQALNQGS